MPASRPVPLQQVQLDDVFWSPRRRINRQQSIPFQYQQCRASGRLDAFRLDWRPDPEPAPHVYRGTDLAKWLEAASYELAQQPEPELSRRVDEVADLILGAQQPDGYLNPYFTVRAPERRWTNLAANHELYSAGHLIEAAVAHHQATGDRKLLDALSRYADLLCGLFGPGEGQLRGYPGHPEIELALVKLYRATGAARYLELCRWFIDQRGQEPNYFEQEAARRGEPLPHHPSFYLAHRPVRELDEVTGHAVRAMYLLCGMADLAVETGDASLAAACRRLWENVCQRRMYLTGGIGSRRINEGFSYDHDLPPRTAYCETCAAIGLIFFNHRLLALSLDGKYADVMERALYNAALSGSSLDGHRFFYENPLDSTGSHHRQTWFGCACCPPNLARLLSSLGGYVASTTPNGVALHLYLQGEVTATVAGTSVSLRQATRYPWDGQVRLTVDTAQPLAWTLALRLPGWCREHQVEVNGDAVAAELRQGYLHLHRTWAAGDTVMLRLAMPVERIAAHPLVDHARGQVALQRGPVVYCLEQCDHDAEVHSLRLPDDAGLKATHEPELLGGVTVIRGEALAPAADAWDATLYRPAPAAARRVPLTAVPYYAWDNRAPGAMVVWLPVA